MNQIVVISPNYRIVSNGTLKACRNADAHNGRVYSKALDTCASVTKTLNTLAQITFQVKLPPSESNVIRHAQQSHSDTSKPPWFFSGVFRRRRRRQCDVSRKNNSHVRGGGMHRNRECPEMLLNSVSTTTTTLESEEIRTDQGSSSSLFGFALPPYDEPAVQGLAHQQSQFLRPQTQPAYPQIAYQHQNPQLVLPSTVVPSAPPMLRPVPPVGASVGAPLMAPSPASSCLPTPLYTVSPHPPTVPQYNELVGPGTYTKASSIA